MQRVGDLHLGHRHFLARARAGIEQPGGMHHQQAADLDLLRHLAELDLHALAVGEPDAEALALLDIGLRDLHAALGEAEPAHAMRQPRRSEPDLRRAQTVADLISTFSAGTSSPSNSSSQWPPCSSGPMIGMRRTMRQPGWSLWNRKP